MGRGSLQCNSTYEKNIGIKPKSVNLAEVEPEKLREVLGIGTLPVDVLSVCPPCTGFSRANPLNHVRDDYRNNLVQRAGLYATALDADIVVMENARELLSGNFREHFNSLKHHLEEHGYHLSASCHMLTHFGLPQVRERALMFAVKKDLPIYTLEDLWNGWKVTKESPHVRSALNAIRPDASFRDAYPKFSNLAVSKRLAAIPCNGGSWTDLIHLAHSDELLTDAMKKRVKQKKLGSHPDVYGRLWWDKPSPTIKRECAHIGNGRYAHPEENRLCSVREMAILQGFPNDFEFNGSSLSNNYRHIGDAVPPLISFQIAWVCDWIFSGNYPEPRQWILPETHLTADNVKKIPQEIFSYAM